MKITKIILTITIIFSAISCQKKEKKNNNELLLLKLITTTKGHKSVLYIERGAAFSYNGYCLDNFSPQTGNITADDYYLAHQFPVPELGILQKNALSKKSCKDLGFSGNATIKEPNGIVFDKYTCGPQGSHCNAKAIKEVGFE